MSKRLPFTRKDLEESHTFIKSLEIAKALYGYDKRTWGNRLMEILREEVAFNEHFPKWLVKDFNPFLRRKEAIGTEWGSLSQLFLWRETEEGDDFWNAMDEYVKHGTLPKDV